MAIRKYSLDTHASKDMPKIRHPMLKAGSTYLIIWQLLQNRPGLTREQIYNITEIHWKRITDMVQAGLLLERGEARTITGKKAKRLWPIPGAN